MINLFLEQVGIVPLMPDTLNELPSSEQRLPDGSYTANQSCLVACVGRVDVLLEKEVTQEELKEHSNWVVVPSGQHNGTAKVIAAQKVSHVVGSVVPRAVAERKPPPYTADAFYIKVDVNQSMNRPQQQWCLVAGFLMAVLAMVVSVLCFNCLQDEPSPFRFSKAFAIQEAKLQIREGNDPQAALQIVSVVLDAQSHDNGSTLYQEARHIKAVALARVERLNEAYELGKATLSDAERALNHSNCSTIVRYVKSANSHINTLARIDALDDAVLLGRAALKCARTFLGEWHPETKMVMNSLASALSNRGGSALEEARLLCLEVLDECRKRVPDLHDLFALQTSANLGQILTDQAQYEIRCGRHGMIKLIQAVELLSEAHAAAQHILPDHLVTNMLKALLAFAAYLMRARWSSYSLGLLPEFDGYPDGEFSTPPQHTPPRDLLPSQPAKEHNMNTHYSLMVEAMTAAVWNDGASVKEDARLTKAQKNLRDHLGAGHPDTRRYAFAFYDPLNDAVEDYSLMVEDLCAVSEERCSSRGL